ncbi:MAG: hypothetical protein JSV89_16965 [Spirochaetaceae bacterium]|nr:MAG: hypothetical protein JSV89_16965 [Spirochaetaceae bacterium]
MSESERIQKSSMMPRKRMSDYIAGVVFNIIFLVVVNKVPDWNIVFITESFPDILWALNTSLAVSIAGNLVLIFFHPRFLHHLLNAVFSVFGILAISVTLSVFPFDFSDLVGDWLTILVRIVLIIGIVGSAIGIVVNIVKAVGAIFRTGE